MMFWVSALITVIVSWPLLATNTRLPLGEITMFQGSAPVVSVLSTTAEKAALGVGLVIRITETLLPAALATKANLLLGSSATLCGSRPTLIFLSTVLVSVRTTETLLSAGLTLHNS